MVCLQVYPQDSPAPRSPASSTQLLIQIRGSWVFKSCETWGVLLQQRSPRQVYDNQRGRRKHRSSRGTQEARRADRVGHRPCRTEADLLPAERNHPGFPRRFRRTVHRKRNQAAADGAWHAAQATGNLPASTSASACAAANRTARDACGDAVAAVIPFIRLHPAGTASARARCDARESAPAAHAASSSCSGAAAPQAQLEPRGGDRADQLLCWLPWYSFSWWCIKLASATYRPCKSTLRPLLRARL